MADSGFFSKGGLGSDLLGYVPLAGGILSSLSSIFGKSDEQIRKGRADKLQKQNDLYRSLALSRAQQLKEGGIKDISRETQTQLGRSQSDIAKRAAAGGGRDAESMLLPVTSNINEAGGKNLENAIQSYDTGINNIENQYDQNAINIQAGLASSPIEPSVADQLLSVAGSVNQQNNYNKYLDAVKGISGDVGTPTNTIPATPSIDTIPSLPQTNINTVAPVSSPGLNTNISGLISPEYNSGDIISKRRRAIQPAYRG